MYTKSKIYHRLLLVVYLQIARVLTAPMAMQPVFVAEPQVMMHTLQQPIPIETFQSLKTQNLQRRPMIPTHQPRPNTNQQLPLMLPTLYPINLEHLQSTQIEGQEQSPLAPMLYQQMEYEQQQIALQQQLTTLHHLQSMQQLNTVHSEFPWSVPQTQPQPMLIILPDEETKTEDHNKFFKNTDNTKENELKHDEDYINEDSDSVVVEIPNHEDKIKTRKAILLIPNARFSIGGIISTIPWLPIEVNVPDTIAWAWNGISSGIASIISIIGSRLPFRQQPPVQVPQMNGDNPSVKMFLKQLQMKNYDPVNHVMPMYMMPVEGVIPVQF